MAKKRKGYVAAANPSAMAKKSKEDGAASTPPAMVKKRKRNRAAASTPSLPSSVAAPAQEKGKLAGNRSPLHIIRRQAARVLHVVLKGNAQRQAVASIKTLIYEPSVRCKKATMALTCQTLKYLPILKELLAANDLLNRRMKVQTELLYVLTFDLLFGEEVSPSGLAESVVLSRKSSLRASLARMLMKKKVSNAEDLLPTAKSGLGYGTVRYVRVNTLKMGVNEAMDLLQKSFEVKQDDLVSQLLTLPVGIDLHNHPLVQSGVLFLQGKASCMPAEALAPDPNWEVLDACAAPGNKTVQLAALMKGRGKIIAVELNQNRLQRLYETVELAGATNVEVQHRDFLRLDPYDASISKVQAILLDPSCSGSGTLQQRLDHLLPSASSGKNNDEAEVQRIERLACFQEKALRHALSFPAVKRVVYSTCSIHQRENEDVVQAVLPYASDRDFHLRTPFPNWPQRGLPIFEGAHHLLRTEPSGCLEGFFIALFVREDRHRTLPREESGKTKPITDLQGCGVQCRNVRKHDHGPETLQRSNVCLQSKIKQKRKRHIQEK